MAVNHPYYLELLKKIIALKKLGVLHKTLSTKDLDELEDYLRKGSTKIGKGYPHKIYQGAKPKYNMTNKTLNKLVAYVKDLGNYVDYNDFQQKEYQEIVIDIPQKPYYDLLSKHQKVIDEIILRVLKEKKKILDNQSKKVFQSAIIGKYYLHENMAIHLLLSIELLEQKINVFVEHSSLFAKENSNNFHQEYKAEQQKLIDEFYTCVKYNTDTINEELISYMKRILDFGYYQNRTKSLQFAKRVFKAARVIYEQIEQEETMAALEFKMYYFRTGFSLKKLDRKQYQIISDNVLKHIELLKERQRINILTYHNFLRQTLGYTCSFDSSFLDTYQDLGKEWKGNIDPANYIKIDARKCKMCHHIRNDELQEVEQWLEEIEIIREEDAKKAEGNIIRFHGKYAFYFLVKGTFYYKKGINFYVAANEILQEAVQVFKMVYVKTYVLELGFTYYILYKIKKEMMELEKAEYYRMKALYHLKNSVKRNYCLFDYQVVLQELVDNEWLI